MYFHSEVLRKEDSTLAFSQEAGNAAAEQAGKEAGHAAEEARVKGKAGREEGVGGTVETEEVSITTIGEWSDPLMGEVVKNALLVDLVAGELGVVVVCCYVGCGCLF